MAAASNELNLLINECNINGVKEFIKNGGNVNGSYENGFTPLLYAIYKSSLERRVECEKIIVCLINAGSDVNAQRSQYNYFTPLIKALEYRLCNNVIYALLNAGADVNGEASQIYFPFPLFYALFCKYDKSIIGELIRRGANVNYICPYGTTPLFYALHRDDNFEIATMLIDAGANVNALDRYGRGKLFQIHCHNNKCSRDYCERNKKVIDLLLDKGADIKHIDKEGRSIMHDFQSTNCKYLMNLFLKCGFSVNMRDNVGYTPLMHACSNAYDSEKVKSLLFLFNADVKCVDYKKDTALHKNATRLNNNTCDLLLYFGSDIFATNKDNKTPLDCTYYTIDHAFFFCHRENLLTFRGLAIFKYNFLFINEDNFSDHFEMINFRLQSLIKLFKRDCLKEVDKLKNTFLKDDLSFYDFMVLKRFHNNKNLINISVDDYNYSKKQIKEQFPLYYNSIILRINDNQMENNKRRLIRAMENIIIRPLPYNESVMDDVKLIYDCMNLISRFFDYNNLYNLFLASVDQ